MTTLAQRIADDTAHAERMRLADVAPELLEALLSAENAVAQLCEGQDERNQCWVTLAQVRTAIAKAKGRNNP